MSFDVLFQFLRVRIVNFVAISKPAMDTLNDRLSVGASGVVKLSTAPLYSLVNRYGRFETAVMCAAVENVACLLLLHTYGLQGAVDRTIPVIEARAQDVFYAAYVYMLSYLSVLVMNLAKYLENTIIGTVVLKMESPFLHLISLTDSILSFFLGEDYLMSMINYFEALPLRAWNYFIRQVEKRVYIPCKKMVNKMQESSAVIAFLSKRIFEAAVFGVLCMSVVFAFFSVYALSEKPLLIAVENEDDEDESSLAFIVDADEGVEGSDEGVDEDEDVGKDEEGRNGEEEPTVNESDVGDDANHRTIEDDTSATALPDDDFVYTASVEDNYDEDSVEQSVTGFTGVIRTIASILDDFLEEDASLSVTQAKLESGIVEESIPGEVLGEDDIVEVVYEVEQVNEESKWEGAVENVEDTCEVQEEADGEEVIVDECPEDIGESDTILREEDSDEVVGNLGEGETSGSSVVEMGVEEQEDIGDVGIPQTLNIAVTEVDISETVMQHVLHIGSDVSLDLDNASIEIGRNLFDMNAMESISISNDRFFLEVIEEESTLRIDQGAEEIAVTLGDARSPVVDFEEMDNSPYFTGSISDMGTPTVIGVVDSLTGTSGLSVSDIEDLKDAVITKEGVVADEVLADDCAVGYSFRFDGDSRTVDVRPQEFFQSGRDTTVERGCTEEVFRFRDQTSFRNSATPESFHVADLAVSTRDSSDIVDASSASFLAIDGITVDAHPSISLLADSVSGEHCTIVEQSTIAALQDGQVEFLLAEGDKGNSVHEPEDAFDAVQEGTLEAAVSTRESFGPFVGPSPQNGCQDVVMVAEIEARCDSSQVASYEDSKTVLGELDEVEEILTMSISAFMGDEVKVSMIESPVPEGTLVGVGVAREGFIFSDSQDLKDIAEMEEAERRYRIRLGKRRAVCGDETVVGVGVGEVASLQGMVGLALDVNEGGSNLRCLVPPAVLPQVDGLGITCDVGVAGKHGINSLDSVSRLSDEEDVHTTRDAFATSKDLQVLFPAGAASIDLQVDLAEGLIDDHLLEVKESIIILEEDAVELSELKSPKLSPSLYSHYRVSSLDALVGIDSSDVSSETTSSILVPTGESAMLRGKFSPKFSLRALAAPFIPKFSKVRAPGSENSPKVPAHWTPAPAIPIVLEAPRRRRVQSGSRRSRHLSLMGISLKDRSTKP